MDSKIMYGAILFLGGWLLGYVFLRQLFFNILTAYPLLKKMKQIDPDLIAPGAMRYTHTSMFVCIFSSAVIIGIVIWLCPKYMMYSFLAGLVLCLILLIPRLSPTNKAMFESFCTAYCRFVPDDELRTVMYNKEIRKIDRRLRELNYSSSFVPEFKS